MTTPAPPVRKYIPKSFTKPGLGPDTAQRAVTHLVVLPAPPSPTAPPVACAPPPPADEPDLAAIVPRAPRTAAITLLLASFVALTALALEVTQHAAIRASYRTQTRTRIHRPAAAQPARPTAPTLARPTTPAPAPRHHAPVQRRTSAPRITAPTTPTAPTARRSGLCPTR